MPGIMVHGALTISKNEMGPPRSLVPSLHAEALKNHFKSVGEKKKSIEGAQKKKRRTPTMAR